MFSDNRLFFVLQNPIPHNVLAIIVNNFIKIIVKKYCSY